MDLIEEHVAHLHRLGRRPGSIDQRRWALRRLARFIAPTPILDVSLDQLRAFTERATTHASATAGEVSHLRRFFEWAIREEHSVVDPTVRLERPSVPPGHPRPMPLDAVQYALTHAPGRIGQWLHLAAYTGLRACEVAPIRGEHVSGRRLFLPEQKGGEPGSVSIPRMLAPTIETWPSMGWVFPCLDGSGPVSAAQVSRLANRWLHSQGIAHTFHTLRHWYGTGIRLITGDVLIAQRALRHKSLDSTLIYTHVDDDEVGAASDGLPDFTEVA